MGYLLTALLLFTPIGQCGFESAVGQYSNRRVRCCCVPNWLCVWTVAGLWPGHMDDSIHSLSTNRRSLSFGLQVIS